MAGKVDRGAVTLTVNASSDKRILLLRTILAYEAGVSGASPGRALHRLVMRHAERADYPEEVRSRLAEIDEARLRTAAEACASERALGETA